ncbi:MAG TPA: hypothetical protein DCW90_05430 [Lachnospiraceae bacterium]|nr:hypothetical protein [Lachnospiraceae bacterium]
MFIFVYYLCSLVIIGAMVAGSTTIISRLLVGTEINVWYKDSICPKCKKVISLNEQIPIFSYLKSKGVCTNCNTRFGNRDFIIELVSLLVLLGAYLFTYKSLWVGLILGVAYNIEMILFILVYHKRERGFFVNYIFSVLFSFVMLLMLSVIRFMC